MYIVYAKLQSLKEIVTMTPDLDVARKEYHGLVYEYIISALDDFGKCTISYYHDKERIIEDIKELLSEELEIRNIEILSAIYNENLDVLFALVEVNR